MTQPAKYTDNRARQVEALNLRREGLTYREIASRLGYSNFQSAARAVQTILKRVETESVTEMRAIENERLDALQMSSWKDALAGDQQAATVILRIMERRARLNGLDAPVRQEVTHSGDIAVTEVIVKHPNESVSD